ncbi:MAG: hypothetical protein OHK0017_10090 [Patescibacteria group bacterium]
MLRSAETSNTDYLQLKQKYKYLPSEMFKGSADIPSPISYFYEHGMESDANFQDGSILLACSFSRSKKHESNKKFRELLPSLVNHYVLAWQYLSEIKKLKKEKKEQENNLSQKIKNLGKTNVSELFDIEKYLEKNRKREFARIEKNSRIDRAQELKSEYLDELELFLTNLNKLILELNFNFHVSKNFIVHVRKEKSYKESILDPDDLEGYEIYDYAEDEYIDRVNDRITKYIYPDSQFYNFNAVKFPTLFPSENLNISIGKSDLRPMIESLMSEIESLDQTVARVVSELAQIALPKVDWREKNK